MIFVVSSQMRSFFFVDQGVVDAVDHQFAQGAIFGA